MYFRALREQLIELARRRIRAGKLTERGLARRCGISQPHMHNVLKGARALSLDTADQLMDALEIRVGDLLWGADEAGVRFRPVPLMRNRIGPGSDPVFSAWTGHIPLPEPLLSGLVEPVAARLAPDLVLPRAFAANDLVLLDQNPRFRSNPQTAGAWVVNESSGLRVRYVRSDGDRLYTADEATLEHRTEWRLVSLNGRNILEIVRARIVWIGREMETDGAGPADPAGEGH